MILLRKSGYQKCVFRLALLVINVNSQFGAGCIFGCQMPKLFYLIIGV